MAVSDNPLLQNLAKCIEDQTSSFRIGIDNAKAAGLVPLLTGWRPAADGGDGACPPRCTTMLENGGASFPILSNQMELNIQILTRAETYFTCRDDAYEIYNVWHNGCCENFAYIQSAEDTKAITILALAPPQSLGVDIRGWFEFSTNYVLQIINLP